MRIKTKRLTETARLPSRVHQGDAGLDLYADKETYIKPQSLEVIDLNIAMSIPDGYVGVVKDRSSLGKEGIHCFAGVIDSGYTGEISIVLYNSKKKEIFRVHQGDKVCQLLIVPILRARVEEVNQLEDTERGDKGFGSTGR